MLRDLAGTLLAGAMNQGPGAPAGGDPLASTLIGTGATLAMTRDKRPVGLVLLAAGGYLMLRDSRKARTTTAPTPASPGRPASA